MRFKVLIVAVAVIIKISKQDKSSDLYCTKCTTNELVLLNFFYLWSLSSRIQKRTTSPRFFICFTFWRILRNHAIRWLKDNASYQTVAKISARTVTVSIETIRVSIVQPVTSCYARTCVHCTRASLHGSRRHRHVRVKKW